MLPALPVLICPPFSLPALGPLPIQAAGFPEANAVGAAATTPVIAKTVFFRNSDRDSTSLKNSRREKKINNTFVFEVSWMELTGAWQPVHFSPMALKLA